MKWKKKLQQPQYALNSEKVFLTATQPAKSVYSYLQTTRLGLTRAEVEDRQLTYGKNEVVHEQKKNPFIVFIKTFINPFIGVLTGLAVISLVIDVLMAEPGEQEWTGVVIIAVMVVCSAILRFWQEWKANEATDSLMKMVKNTCLVKRAGSGEEELDITELVPGDIVFLAAGDMIPADLRIIESKDLFISQASLTGESEPIEKFPEVKEKQYRKGSIVELDNICYMGSTVISGAAKGIVFETGNRTFLGTIARNLTGHRATSPEGDNAGQTDSTPGHQVKIHRLAPQKMCVECKIPAKLEGFSHGIQHMIHPDAVSQLHALATQQRDGTRNAGESGKRAILRDSGNAGTPVKIRLPWRPADNFAGFAAAITPATDRQPGLGKTLPARHAVASASWRSTCRKSAATACCCACCPLIMRGVPPTYTSRICPAWPANNQRLRISGGRAAAR